MSTPKQPKRIAGFTLLEVMITVAIVGILAAIALPSYGYFVTRSRIVEATTTLGDMRSQMEKWFMDNRTYLDPNNGGACAANPWMANYNAVANNKFNLRLGGGGCTATAYEIQADGVGPMSGFSYSINEQNVKQTIATPWGMTSAVCFVDRKDGTCL